MSEMGVAKECIHCKQEKPLSAFYLKQRDDYVHECIDCRLARANKQSINRATHSTDTSSQSFTTQEIEVGHQKVAGKLEAVSMGLSVTSGVVAVGATLAAPTGLSAIGVVLGLVSAPLIVTAAPIVGVAATVTGVVSGGAYFYSKWKSRKSKRASGNK